MRLVRLGAVLLGAALLIAGALAELYPYPGLALLLPTAALCLWYRIRFFDCMARLRVARRYRCRTKAIPAAAWYRTSSQPLVWPCARANRGLGHSRRPVLAGPTHEAWGGALVLSSLVGALGVITRWVTRGRGSG